MPNSNAALRRATEFEPVSSRKAGFTVLPGTSPGRSSIRARPSQGFRALFPFDPVSGMTDALLLKRITLGDSTAFSILVENHAPRAWKIAARYLARREDVEEAVQDAFVRVWARASDFDETRASFPTWFHTILVRKCIDRLRRLKSHLDAGPDLLNILRDDRPDPEALNGRRNEDATVRAAIDSLPERQKSAVILCYIEDMPQDEAAKIMGVHIKALEGLLHRAKQSLKGQLAQLNTYE